MWFEINLATTNAPGKKLSKAARIRVLCKALDFIDPKIEHKPDNVEKYLTAKRVPGSFRA